MVSVIILICGAAAFISIGAFAVVLGAIIDEWCNGIE